MIADCQSSSRVVGSEADSQAPVTPGRLPQIAMAMSTSRVTLTPNPWAEGARLESSVLPQDQHVRQFLDVGGELCCFEDVSKTWCHRTLLGEWISQKTGEDVPER
jgi:hypothetical protein